MTTLYLAEQGSKLQKLDLQLRVMQGDTLLQAIPLMKVERVVVVGRGVSISTPAMFALTKRGVEIVYLKTRGGYGFRVTGSEHKHSELRYKQALTISRAEKALPIAKDVVKAKILNQRVLVQRHAEQGAWAHKSLLLMQQMAQRVDDAKTADVLRGFEGQAAKNYFVLFRQLLKQPLGFEKRIYYPPTDPVNSLLSFGYTLLLNEVVGACQVAGLDPYLGFLHAVDYGRPSLALDLEEPFRPVIVDSLVLQLVNRKTLQAEHFITPKPRKDGKPQAVTLRPDAKRIFLEAFEKRMLVKTLYPQGPLQDEQHVTYRRSLLLQAYQMADVMLGKRKWFEALRIR